MNARISKRDVEVMGGRYMRGLVALGVDVTGWTIHAGSSTYSYAWRVADSNGSTVLRLPSSTREAYAGLQGAVQAVEHLATVTR